MCSQFSDRCPSTSKKFRNIFLFAPLLGQNVFVNFSANTAPTGTKLVRHCQWPPTMLVQWSNGSPRAFLGFRLVTDTILANIVFLSSFFTSWLEGSSLQKLRETEKNNVPPDWSQHCHQPSISFARLV